MAQYRAQVQNWDPAEPVRDAIVNTVYFDTDALPGSGFDADQVADDLNQLWRTSFGSLGQFRTRIYNMSDAEPRQPLADRSFNHVKSTALGPREVALCLSYYAGSNTPRRRGRIYTGPWNTSDMTSRPGLPSRNALLDFATGLANIGGVNMQWVQYSPTTGDFSNVTNVWVDDEWDTMRSRGRKATSRVTRAVEG